MIKGTNEYVDEEDRPYEKPEPDPDRQREDEFYRQEDEQRRTHNEK